MMVDADWINEQISKYINYLDKMPHSEPTNHEQLRFYAAGLRDMAIDIRDNIMNESQWATLRQFLNTEKVNGKLLAELFEHGWNVKKQEDET